MTESTRVSFIIKQIAKRYMLQQQAERFKVSMAEWLRQCLHASYAAQYLTDQIGSKDAPYPEQYSPPKGLFPEEMPPAFFVPFGPVPAIERRVSTKKRSRALEKHEKKPGPPPVIELLPKSNPGSYKSYIVQPGDVLSNIASQFYGDSSKFTLIAQANNIQPPYVIYVGQELVIPDEQLAPRISEAFVDNCGTWHTYTVQAGDTLSSIAADFYGGGNFYWRIANCNNILPPGYVIYVGDVLNIPALVK